MKPRAHSFKAALRLFIAAGWIFMGLYSKVLDMMPRHRLIVARIIGDESARTVIVIIGVIEIAIALWVLSKLKPVLCAIVQTAALVTMNVFELLYAPDLLLLGPANVVVTALCLSAIWFFSIGPDATNGGQPQRLGDRI